LSRGEELLLHSVGNSWSLLLCIFVISVLSFVTFSDIVSDLIVNTFIPKLLFLPYLYCVLTLEESLYILAYIVLQLMTSTFQRCANLHVFDRHLIGALFSSHAVASCPVSHGPSLLLSVC
jgi:hypothetical protein